MTTDKIVKKRQALEKRIFKSCVNELLKDERNFSLGVNDGEEIVIEHSRDAKVIFKAAFSTDEDFLLVYIDGKIIPSGWVRFVYGNSGWDVICDYTTWLEPYIKETEALATQLELNAS